MAQLAKLKTTKNIKCWYCDENLINVNLCVNVCPLCLMRLEKRGKHEEILSSHVLSINKPCFCCATDIMGYTTVYVNICKDCSSMIHNCNLAVNYPTIVNRNIVKDTTIKDKMYFSDIFDIKEIVFDDKTITYEN